jgi:hypothetical protein
MHDETLSPADTDAVTRMRKTQLRIVAVLLALFSFALIPLAFLSEDWGDPASNWEAIGRLAMLLLPAFSLVALIFMVRWLIRRTLPPLQERRNWRGWYWIGGPFTLVWAVFEMTRSAPAAEVTARRTTKSLTMNR